MKRGWIAVVMIALSLICGGFEYIFVTSNADVYVGMLDDADDKMEHSLIKDAESVVRRLDHRFRSESGVLNMFMNHGGADNISSDLAMLCRYAQSCRRSLMPWRKAGSTCWYRGSKRPPRRS